MIETTMNFVAAGIAGIVIGVFFFGGLQWTLRNYLNSSYAGIFLTISMLIRMGFAVVGFYFVGQGEWRQILVCLVGFLISRTLILKFSKPFEARPA